MKRKLLTILLAIFVIFIACNKEETPEPTPANTSSPTTQTGQVTSTTQTGTTTPTTQSGTTQLSSEKDILSFKIHFGQYGEIAGTISGTNITVVVPVNAEKYWTGLKPMVEVSPKADVSPYSLQEVNFMHPPVTYTVTAEDGSKKEYYATVKIDTSTEVEHFSLSTEDERHYFTGTKATAGGITTYTFEIDDEHNIKRLRTIIRLKDKLATVQPADDSVVDFSQPVRYTVTDTEGNKRDFIVVVRKLLPRYIAISQVNVIDNNGAKADEIIIKTNYLPSKKEDISLTITSVINPQLSYPLRVVSIDKASNKITAEVPNTYYSCTYYLNVSYDGKTPNEKPSVLLNNGLPYFAGVQSYSGGKAYKTLVFPKEDFQVYLYGKDMRQYELFLRKNGVDYPFIRKYNVEYLDMPNLPSTPIESGRDFYFVIKVNGREYVFPFVNHKQEPIEVLVANKPVITSISRNVVDKGQEITVYGRNLNFDFMHESLPNMLVLEKFRKRVFVDKVRADRDRSVTYKINDEVPAGEYEFWVRLLNVDTESERYEGTIRVRMPESTHPRLRVTKALIYSKYNQYFPCQVQLTFNEAFGSARVKEIVYPHNIRIANLVQYTNTVLTTKLDKDSYNEVENELDGYALIEENGREYRVYFNTEVY